LAAAAGFFNIIAPQRPFPLGPPDGEVGWQTDFAAPIR
jgi:hypothetical protein